MSRGLYTVAEVARYLGKRPQEVAVMVDRDALPALQLPGDVRMVRKFTLHGLHAWLKERHTGSAFMTVEELAMEIELANSNGEGGNLGMLQLRAATGIVFEMLKSQMERSAV